MPWKCGLTTSDMLWGLIDTSIISQKYFAYHVKRQVTDVLLFFSWLSRLLNIMTPSPPHSWPTIDNMLSKGIKDQRWTTIPSFCNRSCHGTNSAASLDPLLNSGSSLHCYAQPACNGGLILEMVRNIRETVGCVEGLERKYILKINQQFTETSRF